MAKKIILFLISLVVVAIIGFSAFIGVQVNKGVTDLIPEAQTRINEATYLKLYGIDKEAFQKAHNYQRITVTNEKEGYGFAVESYDLTPDKDIFILIHGMGATAQLMDPYCEMFLERGFACVAYDQQNSGHHPVLKNNMGVKEKEDLISVVHWLKTQYPQGRIHIFAESYGAHTVLHAYSAIKDDIGLMVLDSPMATGEYYIDQGLQQAATAANLPYKLFRVTGNIASKVLEGYTYAEANGIDQVESIEQPLLIIANKRDEVTPFSETLAIEDKAIGKKELLLSHSKHAEMYFTERERYLKTIDKFLAENLV